MIDFFFNIIKLVFMPTHCHVARRLKETVRLILVSFSRLSLFSYSQSTIVIFYEHTWGWALMIDSFHYNRYCWLINSSIWSWAVKFHSISARLVSMTDNTREIIIESQSWFFYKSFAQNWAIIQEYIIDQSLFLFYPQFYWEYFILMAKHAHRKITASMSIRQTCFSFNVNLILNVIMNCERALWVMTAESSTESDAT